MTDQYKILEPIPAANNIAAQENVLNSGSSSSAPNLTCPFSLKATKIKNPNAPSPIAKYNMPKFVVMNVLAAPTHAFPVSGKKTSGNVTVSNRTNAPMNVGQSISFVFTSYPLRFNVFIVPYQNSINPKRGMQKNHGYPVVLMITSSRRAKLRPL